MNRDFYLDFLLDHYKNPRNFGELDNPDISYEGGNPLCGDEITIEMKFQDGKVSEVKFRGKGCTISIASASILTELIKGKTKEEIKNLDNETLLKAIGVDITPTRMKCALLPLEVVKIGIFGKEILEEDSD